VVQAWGGPGVSIWSPVSLLVLPVKWIVASMSTPQTFRKAFYEDSTRFGKPSAESKRQAQAQIKAVRRQYEESLGRRPDADAEPHPELPPEVGE